MGASLTPPPGVLSVSMKRNTQINSKALGSQPAELTRPPWNKSGYWLGGFGIQETPAFILGPKLKTFLSVSLLLLFCVLFFFLIYNVNVKQKSVWRCLARLASYFAEKAIDVAFAIGASGPKGSINFARMVSILKTIVNEYRVSSNETALALVDYNGPANARIYFSDSYTKEDFKTNAENVPSSSRPGSLSGALKVAREEVFTTRRGERPFAENILIVMTVGGFDENSADLKEEIGKLREFPVKIIPVLITDTQDKKKKEKLKVIASADNLPVVCLPHNAKEKAREVPFKASQGLSIT